MSFFGTKHVKPGYLDGSVRAKQAFEKIEKEVKSNRIREAAKRIYNHVKNSDSVLTGESVEEIDCRLRTMQVDKEGDANREKNRFDEQLKERRGLDSKVLNTAKYDWRVRQGGGSRRPNSSDIIPGPDFSAANRAMSPPSSSGSKPGTAQNPLNTISMQYIQPKYSPLKPAQPNGRTPMQRLP
jgi:hypothetical protein